MVHFKFILDSQIHSFDTVIKSVSGQQISSSSSSDELVISNKLSTSFVNDVQQQNNLYQIPKPIGSERETKQSKPSKLSEKGITSTYKLSNRELTNSPLEAETDSVEGETSSIVTSSTNSSPVIEKSASTVSPMSIQHKNQTDVLHLVPSNKSSSNESPNNKGCDCINCVNSQCLCSLNIIAQTNRISENEKLKIDLLKQTEMSNKLETLCLQYRQVR